MKNVQPHIKALHAIIQKEENQLIGKKAKWEAETGGNFYKWQREQIDGFLNKKALINTISESWLDLAANYEAKHYENELDGLIGQTTVLAINAIFMRHFEPVLKWMRQYENKVHKPPFEIEVYNLIKELTAVIKDSEPVVKPYYKNAASL